MTEPATVLDESVLAEMQFLLSSRMRIRILAALTDQTSTESALTDALDAPQATVNQNLRKLADRGLIEECAGEYRATWRGEALAETVGDFGRRMAAVDDLEPFLRHVPVAAVRVAALADADVTAARPNRPEAPVERLVELFGGATVIRMLTPYVVPRAVERVPEHLAAEGTRFELVTTAAAFSALLEDWPHTVARSFDGARASLYTADGSLPFAVLFFDDRLVLVGFDETGVPQATVEATDAEALAWGDRLYREQRASASLVRSA